MSRNRTKRAVKVRKVCSPKRSRLNTNLLNRKYSLLSSVSYSYVRSQSPEYEHIKRLITNRNFVIDNLIEVTNPFLQRAYELKKEKKLREFKDLRELLLFHGTKRSNIHEICSYNFNWRLYGQNRGHKYGKGVCFSRNANYASNYADKTFYKVMIVAKVLVGKACEGHEDMELPPYGYDTSEKKNGLVTVKYEDNEFYPAYLIYYHIQKDNNRRYVDNCYDHYYHYRMDQYKFNNGRYDHYCDRQNYYDHYYQHYSDYYNQIYNFGNHF